jgi:hypothetical protein
MPRLEAEWVVVDGLVVMVGIATASLGFGVSHLGGEIRVEFGLNNFITKSSKVF